MHVAIVLKADGTIQCQTVQRIPLDHHAAELRRLGASEICAQTNLQGPDIVTNVCGAPTGRVNAFAIPERDWHLISTGTSGTLGFRQWLNAPYPAMDLPGECEISPMPCPGGSLSSTPVLVRELIGRPVRCYGQGDQLSTGFIPERVNMEHDEDGRISDVWIG